MESRFGWQQHLALDSARWGWGREGFLCLWDAHTGWLCLAAVVLSFCWANIVCVTDVRCCAGETSQQAVFIQAVAWQCCSKVHQHNEIHKKERQLKV